MKILVRNTVIEVSPYKRGDSPELEESLKIYDGMWKKLKMECFDIVDETLYLPRSQNIRALEKIFYCRAIFDRDPQDIDKVQFKLICDPRDKFQFKAMNFLATREEFERFSGASRLNLELGTGIGKTYCAIAALWYYKVRGIVIMHLDNLIQQWKDRIKKYTNMVDRDIYIISGKPSIEKLLKNGVSSYKIILASHSTLRAYAKSEGPQALTDLFLFMKLGAKINDEAHMEFANIMRIDFHTNVKKNFYLTATAGRSDFKENILYQRVLGSAPSLSLKIDDKDKKVAASILQYDSHPTQIEEHSLTTMGRLNSSKYLDYTIFNKKAKIKLYKCLKIAINTLKDIDGQITILVGIKKAVPEVRKFIVTEFPELKDMIGELHSNIPKKDKAEQLKHKVILTTFKSFGTGTDIPEMMGIINLEPYASDIIAIQLIGRLRNKGYYIEIFNKGILRRLRQFNRAKPHIASAVKKITIHEV